MGGRSGLAAKSRQFELQCDSAVAKITNGAGLLRFRLAGLQLPADLARAEPIEHEDNAEAEQRHDRQQGRACPYGHLEPVLQH